MKCDSFMALCSISMGNQCHRSNDIAIQQISKTKSEILILFKFLFWFANDNKNYSPWISINTIETISVFGCIFYRTQELNKIIFCWNKIHNACHAVLLLSLSHTFSLSLFLFLSRSAWSFLWWSLNICRLFAKIKMQFCIILMKCCG